MQHVQPHPPRVGESFSLRWNIFILDQYFAKKTVIFDMEIVVDPGILNSSQKII